MKTFKVTYKTPEGRIFRTFIPSDDPLYMDRNYSNEIEIISIRTSVKLKYAHVCNKQINITNYKAYIAANMETKSFDFAYGKTASSAIAAVKRNNSPDWKDCYVWVVYIHENGEEEKINQLLKI